MRSEARGAAAGALLVGALVLAGCDSGPSGPHALRPNEVAVVAQGKQVYDRHCAACHGAQLQGQPNWRMRDASGRLPAPPHDASGHTWHHTDEVLFNIVKYGVAKTANLKDYETAMPLYEGVLSDAEIVAVLSYIKANWPEDIRRKHDELNAAQAKNKQ